MIAERAGAAKLLPTSQTPFEGALVETGARISAVPVPIDTINRPTAVTARFLPFVAWGLSVDVWPSAGDDTAHRAAVAASLPLHMRKGTPYAIRRYVALAGAAVVRLRRPPALAHAGQSFRDADRAAWLAHYPQLRIYPYRGRERRPWQFFAAVAAASVKSGPKRRFVMASTAAARAGRRATLYDRGIETDLNVTVTARLQNNTSLVERELVHLKTFRPHLLAAGVLLRNKRFAGALASQSNTVRLEPSQAFGAIRYDRVRQIVAPGLTPIDATPVEMHVRSTPLAGKLFAGRGARRFIGARAFVYPSRAFLHVYDVLWLYRPGVNVAPGRGRFFARSTRLGIPAFNAEAKVRIRRTVSARKLFAGGYAAHGHACAPDRTRLDETLRAVRSARALRDQISINLNCTDFLRASNQVVASEDLVCGAQVETI